MYEKQIIELNIISKDQYNVLSNISAFDTISDVTNYRINMLIRGNNCLGILLDLVQAFDTAEYTRLHYKLEEICIKEVILK